MRPAPPSGIVAPACSSILLAVLRCSRYASPGAYRRADGGRSQQRRRKQALSKADRGRRIEEDHCPEPGVLASLSKVLIGSEWRYASKGGRATVEQ